MPVTGQDRSVTGTGMVERVRAKDVLYFTPREEAFVTTLTDLGIKKNVAKTLVCLTHVKDASSYDIERGADLRQSEVSHALKYLTGQGWVKHRVNKKGSHGRPIKIFELTTTLPRIIDAIESEKMTTMTGTLNRIRELREYTLRTDSCG